MDMNKIDIPEPIIQQLDALNAVYLDAADRKDLILCDKIRFEIQRVLTGKKLMIPMEDSLNPTYNPMQKNLLS